MRLLVPRRIVKVGAVIAALAFVSAAQAHDRGISQSDFIVEGRTVRAALVFASDEARALVHGTDPTAREEEARDLVTNGIAVTADDAPCAASLDAARIEDGDFAIDATFACPHEPRILAVTIYLISELPRGHRHVARIIAGDSTAEELLDAERRRVTLEVRSAAPHPRQPDARSRVMFLVGIAVALVIACALAINAARRARAAPTRRGRGASSS